MTETMEWREVAKATELTEDQPLAVKVEGVDVGIYLLDGQYYAMEDVCPHAYALLTQGFVDGCEVECPLHEAIFNITSGKLVSGPGQRDLHTYEVRIEEDKILLRM